MNPQKSLKQKQYRTNNDPLDYKHGGQPIDESYQEQRYGTQSQNQKYPRTNLQDSNTNNIRSEQFLDQILSNQKKQELFNNIQDFSNMQTKVENLNEPTFSKTSNVESFQQRDSIVNQNITVQNITIQQVTMVSSQRKNEEDYAEPSQIVSGER